MFLAPMTIVPKRTHGDGGNVLFVNRSERCRTVGPAHDIAPADLRSPPPKRIRREAARPKKCPLSELSGVEISALFGVLERGQGERPTVPLSSGRTQRAKPLENRPWVPLASLP